MSKRTKGKNLANVIKVSIQTEKQFEIEKFSRKNNDKLKKIQILKRRNKNSAKDLLHS
jgi:hypothetical protein